MVSFMAFVLQVMEMLFQGTILEFLLNYQRTFLEVYNVMIQVYLNFSRSHQCNGAFNMLAFVPLDWLEDVIDVYSSIVAWSEDTFSIIAVSDLQVVALHCSSKHRHIFSCYWWCEWFPWKNGHIFNCFCVWLPKSLKCGQLFSCPLEVLQLMWM